MRLLVEKPTSEATVTVGVAEVVGNIASTGALIPEGADTLQTVTGVAGRLSAVYAHAGAHRIRIYAEDGAHLRDLALPTLGAVNRNEGEGGDGGLATAGRGRSRV